MKIDKLIAQWMISSGGDLINRQIQFVNDKTGWQGFVEYYVRPVLNQGIKRLWLHGPFGKDGSRTLTFSDGAKGVSDYRFDEYLESLKRGFDWDTDDFVDEIRPLTQNGIEVICYLGTLDGTYEFEGKDVKKFLNHFTESLAPILDSGCSLSIDSSCRAKEGSWPHHAMALLKAKGVKLYIESVPLLTAPHLQHWDMVCCDTHWPNVVNNPNLYPKPTDLGGDVVRMLCSAKPDKYPTYKEWYLDLIPKMLNEDNGKYSVCANLTHYLNAGGTVAELVK